MLAESIRRALSTIKEMDQQLGRVSSGPQGIEHNGPTIKEIGPEDDELWQERGD